MILKEGVCYFPIREARLMQIDDEQSDIRWELLGPSLDKEKSKILWKFDKNNKGVKNRIAKI